MYTNTSCTIFSKNDTGYDIIPISACYWQEVKAHEVKNYGAELADSVKIIIPLSALGGYKSGWKITEGSYIAEGETTSGLPQIDSIEPLIESGEVFSIRSVTDNLRGSENIQHITIGAG